MPVTEILRRMIDNARPAPAEGAPGADRGWRLALARAARDALALEVEFLRLAVTRQGLPEILEQAPDRALVALLDGPKGGLGVMLLSAPVTSAVIEMQTLGRLSAQVPPPRKPTRIDAAMVAGFLDRALAGLEDILAEEDDLSWAGGFRYASFLEDVRPLGLLLEEDSYCVLRAEVSLGSVQRKGEVILALPAKGRGERAMKAGDDAAGDAPQFTSALAGQVEQATARLDAVIGRLTLSIRQVMALTEGEVLLLPQAGVDAVTLETLDGRPVALGRLGQHRGQRALKLSEAASLPQAAAAPAAFAPRPPAEDLRPTG